MTEEIYLLLWNLLRMLLRYLNRLKQRKNNTLKRNAYTSEIKSYQNNSDQLQCQCYQALFH